MEWVILWVGLSFLAAFIAKGRGRSGITFFFLALLLSPLIGIIAALVVAPGTGTLEQAQIDAGTGKKCPYCAEVIKPEAIVCRYCGRDLVEQPKETAQIFATLPDESTQR